MTMMTTLKAMIASSGVNRRTPSQMTKTVIIRARIARDREETPESEWGNTDDATVTLNVGGALQRLRDVVCVSRRRATLMDELREVRAWKEYNGKKLCVKLHCKTR